MIVGLLYQMPGNLLSCKRWGGCLFGLFNGEVICRFRCKVFPMVLCCRHWCAVWTWVGWAQPWSSPVLTSTVEEVWLPIRTTCGLLESAECGSLAQCENFCGQLKQIPVVMLFLSLNFDCFFFFFTQSCLWHDHHYPVFLDTITAIFAPNIWGIPYCCLCCFYTPVWWRHCVTPQPSCVCIHLCMPNACILVVGLWWWGWSILSPLVLA